MPFSHFPSSTMLSAATVYSNPHNSSLLTSIIIHLYLNKCICSRQKLLFSVLY